MFCVKRWKCLFLLKIDNWNYFYPLGVCVLQDPFVDFAQLACELVHQVTTTCSIAKYIYNEVLCEQAIKIYLSYILRGRKRIFIRANALQFLQELFKLTSFSNFVKFSGSWLFLYHLSRDSKGCLEGCTQQCWPNSLTGWSYFTKQIFHGASEFFVEFS